MSLVNQLIAATLAVLLGLLSGTLYITSDSSKRLLMNQLQQNALDTATHMGLYLAPFIAAEDRATVETTVNAIFDSGYYQRIDVKDRQGHVLFSKTVDSRIAETVPQWFVDLVRLDPPEMTRDVTYNWKKVGAIYVQGHPGYAYEAYWRAAKETLIYFVLLSLVSALIITLLLRAILKPLKAVEDQALALSRKQYIEQPSVPKTRELRRVVEAMNLMVRQVRQMFDEQSRNIEELRRNAYQDELTGLPNARAAQAQLTERLDYRKDFGPCTLLYLHLVELQAINHRLGIEKTNNLIRLVAEQLRRIAREDGDHIIGRLSGADFALLIARPSADRLRQQVERLFNELDRDFQQLAHASEPTPIRLGLTHGSDQTGASQLLSNARLALENAAAQAQRQGHYQPADQPAQGDESWHEHVSGAIRNRQIFLQAQPVIALDGRTLQREVFARILNRDNAPCSAGDFISVVRELGLMAEMDRAVAEQVFDHLRHHPDADPIAINLSTDAIASEDFRTWLLHQVAPLEARERICIELNESSVLNNLDRIEGLRSSLRELGCHFGVDNFGVHPAGFGYLYRLQPDYIKIDGSLLQAIERDAQDQFFVSSLISVAHSLDIAAYGERVETEGQLSQLRQLKIDATQGYLHGTPHTLGR